MFDTAQTVYVRYRTNGITKRYTGSGGAAEGRLLLATQKSLAIQLHEYLHNTLIRYTNIIPGDHRMKAAR